MDEIEQKGVEEGTETEASETETTEADSEATEVETVEASKETKPKETDEARRGRLQRELTKLNKRLGAETKEAPKDKKSDEYDEGQLAYLVAKGIDSDEDIDFTRAEQKKAGGSLRELLGNEYFKAKLEARKQAKIAADAMPSNSKRSSTRPSDSVDYEYAKYIKSGKLPADREMREKLVDMRRKKETVDNEFGS